MVSEVVFSQKWAEESMGKTSYVDPVWRWVPGDRSLCLMVALLKTFCWGWSWDGIFGCWWTTPCWGLSCTDIFRCFCEALQWGGFEDGTFKCCSTHLSSDSMLGGWPKQAIISGSASGADRGKFVEVKQLSKQTLCAHITFGYIKSVCHRKWMRVALFRSRKLMMHPLLSICPLVSVRMLFGFSTRSWLGSGTGR